LIEGHPDFELLRFVARRGVEFLEHATPARLSRAAAAGS
jgi:hypothetical protein